MGHVAASDTNVDAAIVLVDAGENKFHPLPFVQNPEYHMGEDVYTIGFPLADILGSSPRLTKGLISSTVGISTDGRPAKDRPPC